MNHFYRRQYFLLLTMKFSDMLVYTDEQFASKNMEDYTIDFEIHAYSFARYCR